MHPKAFDLVERQHKTGNLSNQFADLLAAAGLREKKNHKNTGKGRGSRRDVEPLSFHSLRRTATTILHEASSNNKSVNSKLPMSKRSNPGVERPRCDIRVTRRIPNQSPSCCFSAALPDSTLAFTSFQFPCGLIWVNFQLKQSACFRVP
jgi:hypothetical protein